MIEYNTKRNKLIIREYARNVQKMVEDTLAIEDRDQRTAAARAIVRVMAQLNDPTDKPTVSPQESIDYWHKLWDHLYIISDYKLDIDSPFPLTTTSTASPCAPTGAICRTSSRRSPPTLKKSGNVWPRCWPTTSR